MHPLALVSSLLVVVALSARVAASPAEEIGAATQAWADAYNSRDPERVLALYDEEAVLWGTVSPVLRDTPAEIRDYFRSMPDRPQARVTIGEHRVRVFGDVAVATGFYTFTNTTNGRIEVNPSRFSFTFRRREGKWWIVDHHSSRVPPPPA